MSAAKLTPEPHSVLFVVNYKTGRVTLPSPADSLEALHLAMGFLLRSAIAINGTPAAIPDSPITAAPNPGGRGRPRKPLSAAHKAKLRRIMKQKALTAGKTKEKALHA